MTTTAVLTEMQEALFDERPNRPVIARRDWKDYDALEQGSVVRDPDGWQWERYGQCFKRLSVNEQRLLPITFAEAFPFTADVPADLDLPTLCEEHLQVRREAQWAEDALNRHLSRNLGIDYPQTPWDDRPLADIILTIERAPFNVPCARCRPRGGRA